MGLWNRGWGWLLILGVGMGGVPSSPQEVPTPSQGWMASWEGEEKPRWPKEWTWEGLWAWSQEAQGEVGATSWGWLLRAPRGDSLRERLGKSLSEETKEDLFWDASPDGDLLEGYIAWTRRWLEAQGEEKERWALRLSHRLAAPFIAFLLRKEECWRQGKWFLASRPPSYPVPFFYRSRLLLYYDGEMFPWEWTPFSPPLWREEFWVGYDRYAEFLREKGVAVNLAEFKSKAVHLARSKEAWAPGDPRLDRTLSLRWEGVALPEAAKDLESKGGVHILFPPSLSEVRVSAQCGPVPLREILRAMAALMGVALVWEREGRYRFEAPATLPEALVAALPLVWKGALLRSSAERELHRFLWLEAWERMLTEEQRRSLREGFLRREDLSLAQQKVLEEIWALTLAHQVALFQERQSPLPTITVSLDEGQERLRISDSVFHCFLRRPLMDELLPLLPRGAPLRQGG